MPKERKPRLGHCSRVEEIPKQAILVVNAASRRGSEAFDGARAALEAAGIELIDSRAVDKPELMAGEITAAIDRSPMVIVGGGDGTLSESIDHFLGKDAVFAVLPLGTANSFARTLGIPLDLEGAVDVIANGIARPIDLVSINGDYFLNNAALGLAPVVAETVPRGLKRLLGRAGYVVWAGWSAASFHAFRLTVEDGRRKHRLWATEVRIANGRFHGGLELIESAHLDSGEVVVQAVQGRSLTKLAWSYLASAIKAPSRHETVREFRARDLRLSTKPRMRVSIDGEVGPETPLHIKVAPNAIRVAAPREPSPPA